jgi:hypothetical protein
MIKQVLSRKPTLWILIVLFSLPLWGAYYLSQHSSWIKQLKTTNYGTWVNPPLNWTTLDKQARPWNLVVWMPDGCDQACFDNLNQLAKIRLAMGRKLYLLDIGLVLPQSQTLSKTIAQDCKEQDIRVIYIGNDYLDAWRTRFAMQPIILFAPEHQALLMYPLYPDAKKLYHDLQQLIK